MASSFFLLAWLVVALHAEEGCKTEGTCLNEQQNQQDVSNLRDFTVHQLQEFTGSSDKTPLYIALLGDVYDVSASADLYGDGMPFHCYAGRDASLAMAKDSCDEALFLENPLNQSQVEHLSDSVQTALNEWIRLFRSEYKYPIVGKVSTPPVNREFTLDSLASHTGQPEHLLSNRVHSEVLVCLNFKVFDVSYGGNSMYGVGKGYHIFAGKDASRALAVMSFEPEHLQSNDLSLLSEEDMQGVLSWEATFLSKYPVVGTCLQGRVTPP
jgi:membrane-associated progesterone receptor component